MKQTGPFALDTIEVGTPEAESLNQGEVLLRILTGGICGSDLPFFLGHRSPMVPASTPGFPLHEIVGEVIASADREIVIGDRVVGWAGAHDGLAEYVVAPGHSLHAFSAALDPAKAVMLQPLACVLYAAEQIGPVAGKSAAVFGVGPIGALFTHVLKTKGASHVIGIDRVDRTEIREMFGMDEFAHSDVSAWAAVLADADRPNVVIEAIGHQVESLTAAVAAASHEGKVFYFGIPNDDVYPIPMNNLVRKNMTLQSGVTPVRHRRRALAAAEAYLALHPELFDAYLTSPYPFAEAESAFEAAIRPRTGQLKVSLHA
ncbi:zinc-dependent alcohol dehydrogenase [Paenarthrobacter nitroguajacolicus]